MNDPGLREESPMPRFTGAKPVYQGKWIRLKSGDQIDIVVGERPGGRMGGTLMIEEKRRGIKNGKLPLFSTVKIGNKDWSRIAETGYGSYDRETPVFRIVSKKVF